MPASPERILASRIGANESWARTVDRAARTSKARAASEARFALEVDAVDPDHLMSDADRAKAITNARDAHFQRMTLASLKARRLRAEVDARDATAGATDV